MRVALLGSPGVGMQRRLGRGMIKGTPAQFLGDPGATYAAVVANHHLDVQVYRPGIGLVTYQVLFTGAENSQATFIARINAVAVAADMKFRAVASGTSVLLKTTQLGSLAEANVLAATSADVKASLGMPVGTTAFNPSFGVRMLATPHSGKSSVLYFGGRKPVISTPQSALQHAITMRAGRVGAAFVVDRQTARTVASDSVHFTPERIPGAG